MTTPAGEVTEQICGSSSARAVLPSQPSPPPWRPIPDTHLLLLQLLWEQLPLTRAQERLPGVATRTPVEETVQQAQESRLWKISPAQLFAVVIYHDQALTCLSCPFVGG